MEEKKYTCDVCGIEFIGGQSDDDARKEMIENFGDYPADECATVCDDCYKELLEFYGIVPKP